MSSREAATLVEVDPSVVDDPFWSTVMEEHPHASYVLLPPGPTLGEPVSRRDLLEEVSSWL